MQLVINHALKNPQISKALGAAMCLVEHFKRSELAASKLKIKQKQMGTSEHKLVQDVSTTWNSTHHMINRLLEQRWPVTATLSDPAVTQRGKQYLDLKSDQWTLLEGLAQAPQAIEYATLQTQREWEEGGAWRWGSTVAVFCDMAMASVELSFNSAITTRTCLPRIHTACLVCFEFAGR